MSQSGFTPIQIYRSSTAAAVPLAADLVAGELAINTTDEKLYFENASGVVKLLASSAFVGTVTSVALSGGTTGLTVSGSPITSSGTITLAGTLAVANGGTGVTSSTGTVAVVLSNTPTLVTPILGAATATSVANGLGVVGTPSYTFTGDLNTGMWSPAADTVAVSTAGAERLRIDSAGLTISDGTITAGGSGDVLIGRFSTGFPSSGAGYFKLRTNNTTASSGGLSIDTLATGTLVERVVIDSAGNVGIGTSAPTSRLQVISPVGTDAAQFSDNTNYTLAVRSGGSATALFTGTAGSAVAFGTNNTEKMRITSAGNFLVGTTSAAIYDTNAGGDVSQFFKAQFTGGGGFTNYGAAMSNGALDAGLGIFGDNSASKRLRIAALQSGYASNTAGAETSYAAFATMNAGVLAERMRITEAGNVGIGVTAPAATLEIATTFSGNIAEVLRLSNPGSGANTQAQIKFLAAGTNYGTITGGYGAAAPQTTFDLPSAGNYVWQQASVEKMRLDASGKLSVGLTTGSNLGTQTKFAASGDASSAASLGSTSTSGTGALDTGISINQGGFGGTLLLIASRNTSTGVNTASAVYMVRFYFDGNNAPTTVFIAGFDFVTFGVSGSQTLTLANAGGGNTSYAWFGNR